MRTKTRTKVKTEKKHIWEKAVVNKTCLLMTIIIMIGVLLAACSAQDDEKKEEVTSIPILTYHKIVPSGVDFKSSLLISEDTFDEQMKFLKDNGYTTLTLDEFYDWYKGGSVPEKSVVVTFDDGYYGTYYLAYPIIKKYDLAATVFCMGHHIEDSTQAWDADAEKDYYVGMDVITKLREEYPKFAFESHTYDMHRKIDGKHPVDVFSYDQMIEDIKKNEAFGFTYLAYPWGDNNETIQKALADSGYKMAFSYGDNYYATRQDNQYAVNRIKISGKMKFEKFKKIVSLASDEHNNPEYQ